LSDEAWADVASWKPGTNPVGPWRETQSDSMAKIYVGNLPWSATDDDLRNLFSAYGDVQSATVIMDRDTGRSRGFGFVEMDDGVARNAISQADGKDLGGRPLRVNEARERPRRAPMGRR
jgi:RNA recognition motif-containing protein